MTEEYTRHDLNDAYYLGQEDLALDILEWIERGGNLSTRELRRFSEELRFFLLEHVWGAKDDTQ